jgi:hypothetical protein
MRFAAVCLLPLLLLTATPARAGSFIDTTITAYFGDDNLLAGPEDFSASPGLSNAYPELFFEGLEAEKTVAVTESHLVIYKKMPGFIKGLETEAAMVLEFEIFRDPDNGQVGPSLSKVDASIQDDGSYLRITGYFDRERMTGPNLSFTMFPFDSQRFLLGFSYDLTWGGERMFPTNFGPVPGFKLNLDLDEAYFFAGFKTQPRIMQYYDNQVENQYGVLWGGGLRAGPFFFDANGGLFDRGHFDIQQQLDSTIYAMGGSAQIGLDFGDEIGESVDFRLYRNDPDALEKASEQIDYTQGVHFHWGTEFTGVAQTAIEFEDPSSTINSWATAGDTNIKLRINRFRVKADVVYRSLNFLVFNTPGLTPYYSLSDALDTQPQFYGAVGVDYFIEPARLTPGIIVGLMQPAAARGGEDLVGAFDGVVVVRDANDLEFLPAGTDPFQILSLKGTLRWDLSQMLAVMTEVSFTLDYNQSKTIGEDAGNQVRVLDETRARQLGLNVMMQAKF